MSGESITKFAVPMLLMNWIFGIGIIEYPSGHQRFILSFFYSTFVLIAYCYLSWFSFPYLLRTTRLLAVNVRGVHFLFYSHAFIVVGSILTGWRRSQGLRSIIRNIVYSDNLLEQIGVPKMYSKKFKKQLFRHALAFLYLLTIISINTSIFLNNELGALEYGYIITTALASSYPTIVMFIVDCTFVNLVNLAEDKLKALNATLRQLLKSTAEYPQHSKIVKLHCLEEQRRSYVHQSDDIAEDVLFKLNTAKKAYVQLWKLCGEINESFGLHLLQSIIIGVGITTICLYEIELVLLHRAELTKSQIYRLSLHASLWITYYFIKFFVFCYSCSNTQQQSIKTGDTISEIYDEPFIGEKAQAQIRDFLFNLTKNYVSFNAKGFITLDFTLIQIIIGAVTTYMMILTQFEQFIFPTCYNSTCVKNK